MADHLKIGRRELGVPPVECRWIGVVAVAGDSRRGEPACEILGVLHRVVSLSVVGRVRSCLFASMFAVMFAVKAPGRSMPRNIGTHPRGYCYFGSLEPARRVRIQPGSWTELRTGQVVAVAEVAVDGDGGREQ